MESSYEKAGGFSNPNVVEDLLEQLGNVLERPIQILIIGGAAMMEYGLKDSTKDIDIVCWSAKDKEDVLRSALKLDYLFADPEKRHERLLVDRIAKKGGQTLDVFAGKISYSFGLSSSMWERARKERIFGRATARYASFEDIFIMKLIANRTGDVPDCAALFSSGLDFEIVYKEIESQYHNSADNDQNVWIAHLEEGVARLADSYDMVVPKDIRDRISYLAYDYNEKNRRYI